MISPYFHLEKKNTHGLIDIHIEKTKRKLTSFGQKSRQSLDK